MARLFASILSLLVVASSTCVLALQIPAPAKASLLSQPTRAPLAGNTRADDGPAAAQTTAFVPPPLSDVRLWPYEGHELELLRRAPSPTIQLLANYTYLGCWQDGSNKILSATSLYDFGLTPELCRNICALKSYKIFGLEGSYYCYCDSAIAGFAVSTVDADCSAPCSGNTNIACGGTSRINIYSATIDLPGVATAETTVAGGPIPTATSGPNSGGSSGSGSNSNSNQAIKTSGDNITLSYGAFAGIVAGAAVVAAIAGCTCGNRCFRNKQRVPEGQYATGMTNYPPTGFYSTGWRGRNNNDEGLAYVPAPVNGPGGYAAVSPLEDHGRAPYSYGNGPGSVGVSSPPLRTVSPLLTPLPNNPYAPPPGPPPSHAAAATAPDASAASSSTAALTPFAANAAEISAAPRSPVVYEAPMGQQRTGGGRGELAGQPKPELGNTAVHEMGSYR